MYKRKIQNQVEENNDIIEEEEEIINSPTPLYKVKVTHPSLRMRQVPSLNGEVEGLITDKGIYDIYEEANGWGQLDNNYWIMLQYTRKIENS